MHRSIRNFTGPVNHLIPKERQGETTSQRREKVLLFVWVIHFKLLGFSAWRLINGWYLPKLGLLFLFCYCNWCSHVQNWLWVDGGRKRGWEERREGRKGFTDKLNHPILSLKGGEVWIDIKEWTEAGVRREGREETRKGGDKGREDSQLFTHFNNMKKILLDEWEGKRKSWGQESEGLSGRKNIAGKCFQVVLIITVCDLSCAFIPCKVLN